MGPDCESPRVVRPGEFLSLYARQCGVDLKQVEALNPWLHGPRFIIRPGDLVNLRPSPEPTNAGKPQTKAADPASKEVVFNFCKMDQDGRYYTNRARITATLLGITIPDLIVHSPQDKIEFNNQNASGLAWERLSTTGRITFVNNDPSAAGIWAGGRCFPGGNNEWTVRAYFPPDRSETDINSVVRLVVVPYWEDPLPSELPPELP